MICPQCGYDMGSKSKCQRCGFVVKTLAVVDSADESEDKQRADKEKVETKVIDPCNVYLTHPYGYDDDEGTGFGIFGNPFASLFDGLFGDPIGDLLGGLFGFDTSPRRSAVREEPQKKKRKQGPVVEVKDVEVLDENGNPIKQNKDEKSHFKRGGKFGK